MKIWFISDTHNEHQLLVIPKADLAIHCGDESTHGNPWMNEAEARRFFDWYSSIDIPNRIFVPGNHSTSVEQTLIRPKEYDDITFLIHEEVCFNGLRIFGSPYTPRFFDWAYMKARNKLDAVWATVPEGLDILVTHGPPKGILDLTHDIETRSLVQVGCNSLRRHVEDRIKPRFHAFGHLHDERGVSNHGMLTRGETTFINCACCDLAGKLRHNGFVIEIPE